jgi:hypothetical protein
VVQFQSYNKKLNTHVGYRVSVKESLTMDTPPRFQLPNDLIQDFDNPHRFIGLDSATAAWNVEFAGQTDISVVLSDIARMAQFINDAAGSAFIWQDIWFMCLRFLPIFHKLLSLPRDHLDQQNAKPGTAIREVVRLTCIVLLSLMNRRFCITPDLVAMYKNQIPKLLINNPVDWSSLSNLRLWVLVIAGLVAEGKERAWLVGEVLKTMDQLGLNTWNEAFSVVKEIIWLDELLNDDANKFGFEIEELAVQQTF